MGESELAEKDLSKAISLNPKDALAFSNRANVMAGQQRWEEAIRDFSAAILLNPSDPYLPYQRGTIYAQLNRIDEALEDFGVATGIGLEDEDSLATISQFLDLLDKK